MSSHTKFAKLQAEVGSLCELATQLRQEVDELKVASSDCQSNSNNPRHDTVDNLSSLPAVTHDSCLPTADNVQTIIHKALYDADRRRRNVIVCGMPENELINDADCFRDVCEH